MLWQARRGLIAGRAAIDGSGDAAETTAFLARTSGLDATHTNAYKALINGLVSDGLFSKFDMLHVYATQDSTTALLNLISTSFNAVLNGGPTFTADRGFTGTNNSTTIYIDTGFNPATASSPKYTLNSSHISIWDASNTGQSAQGTMGANDGTNTLELIPTFTDNLNYIAINGNSFTTVSNANPQGHFIANRSGSSAVQSYKNGSSIASASVTTTGLPNASVSTIAMNISGTRHGSNIQASMASIGSSLSGTDATNFYNRLRTFMTAVGVP